MLFSSFSIACFTSSAAVVFKLDSAGRETVLHGFGGPDGANVLGAVVRDAKGNFYGTTEFGGDFGNGTVFRIDTSGQVTVLHSFADSPDGLNPYTGSEGVRTGNHDRG
jgi:uncharacterized repeat protein (TIGR03803 family)